MPPCLPEGRQWEAEWPEKGTSVDVEVVVEFEGELALGVGGADDPAGVSGPCLKLLWAERSVNWAERQRAKVFQR